MAKRTVLDMTQGILSEMGSDSVNSISDTIEATSVAEVLRQVYFELIDEMDLPTNRKLVSLEGLSDTTKPTHMRIPENVSSVKWVKYDTRNSVSGNKAYSTMHYMIPSDFVTLVNSRPSTDTVNYQVVQYDSNIPLIVGKTHHPTYWTSFDDEYIIFDSYKSSLDSTLQSSKSMCEVEFRPTFTLSDTFIPDLPENLFNNLYTQALTRCIANHKMQINPKAEQSERRFRIRAQRNKWRVKRATDSGPNYARK
jgi:hypothetical protein